MAAQPPFLLSQGTYATFQNCLFHSVRLPSTQLFDVSHLGTVALVDTLFVGTTFPEGVVGTQAAESDPPSPNSRSPGTDDSLTETYDTYETYDDSLISPQATAAAELRLQFSPASTDDAARFGAEFVAVDETMSDCRGGRRRGMTLPGCPPVTRASTEGPKTAPLATPGPGSGDVLAAECGGADADRGADVRSGLGYCAQGRWQVVVRGERLSVEDPWLTALAEVCTVGTGGTLYVA